MRRMVIAAISLLALLSVASADAASFRYKATAKCRLAHSGQFAANPHAQLYVAPAPHALPEFLGVYGCVYGRRPVFLGGLPDPSSQGDEGVTHVKLAGSVAAYEKLYIGGYESERAEWRVTVLNLRNGRILHRASTGEPLAPLPEYVGVGQVVSLVLKSNGSVAWIADDYQRSRPFGVSGLEVPYFDVYELDRTGTRLLASGADIDPHSLVLAGSIVYWTQGGKSFSAPLN